MSYVEKYKKIVDKLVRRSFPELKEKVKVVEYSKLIFWTHSFAERGFSNYYIFLNKIRRKASKESLKGQFAHELCHIVLCHSKCSFLGDFFHNVKKFTSWAINTKFSRDIERKVDIEVVKRGFGKFLICEREDWERVFSARGLKEMYSRGYLSPKEIKSYMRKYKR